MTFKVGFQEQEETRLVHSLKQPNWWGELDILEELRVLGSQWWEGPVT